MLKSYAVVDLVPFNLSFFIDKCIELQRNRLLSFKIIKFFISLFVEVILNSSFAVVDLVPFNLSFFY